MDITKKQNMTPDEYKEFYEKAMKEAREAWDKLTPEEKAKAEVEGKKLYDEKLAEARSQWDQMQKLIAEREAKRAKQAEGAPVLPKFCTECGAPVAGGRFCTECGHKLV